MDAGKLCRCLVALGLSPVLLELGGDVDRIDPAGSGHRDPGGMVDGFLPGKWTKDLLMWMQSTKMMPAVGVLIPIYLLFQRTGLFDTRIGLILALMLMNLPIIVWMLYTYFKEIPAEILEAARMDGASLRNQIIHVLTPMAIPGIASTI